MKKLLALCTIITIFIGCGGSGESDLVEAPAATGAQVKFEAPKPLEVPEPKEPTSDEDWQALAHNKDIEVIQVLNIINPVAAYLTAGFEQYGEQIDNRTLHEEWADTGQQLTQALTLYKDCKKRMEAKQFNKQLFLDLENSWQILVKTGVAGIRTKQMLDAELAKL